MPTSTRQMAPVFTEIQCEFEGAQWGDVGIDPYEPPGKNTKEPRNARLYYSLDY